MPKTINPTTEEIIENYYYISDEELENKISLAQKAFEDWKNVSIDERKKLFLKFADLMMEKKEELAKLDTIEMWMLYNSALWDVEKSATWTIYFSNHAKEWLKDIEFEDMWIKGKRVFEPLGVIYTISPWNFPYNQVLRNAVPNILAGNVVLSKHASNVPQVARKIEELFLEAWFPLWVFQNLQISSSKSEKIIADERIKWTNITSWEYAWRNIWELAWKNLKPSILELWGSDPFVVLDCKNIDDVVNLAIKWRFSANWQKCNSSKRFIIVEKYFDEFVAKYTQKVKNLNIWDPFDKNTDIWPLAKLDRLKELDDIVQRSVKLWAKILTWWKRVDRKWYFYEPTVIVDIDENSPVFVEETFGPVAPIIKAKDEEHAIYLANHSKFGLTSCLITQSKEKFEKYSKLIESWNVFWNKIPTSYPFLPYWGIKNSWYWKELWERWMKNFTNEKIIVY